MKPTIFSIKYLCEYTRDSPNKICDFIVLTRLNIKYLCYYRSDQIECILSCIILVLRCSGLAGHLLPFWDLLLTALGHQFWCRSGVEFG